MCCLALLAAVPSPLDAAVPAGLDYRLEVRLDPDRQLIEGRATLSAIEQPPAPPLLLDERATVSSVTVDGRAVPFSQHRGTLRWTAPTDVPGRTVTVVYRATFDDPLPTDTIGIEDPSYGVNAAITPRGSYLGEGVAWFPLAPDRRGRHQLRLTAPPGVLAVTAGRFLGARDDGGMTVTEWTNDVPLTGLALAAGAYRIAADELDGIQLLTFLSAENAPLAPAYLAAMRRHLALYRELLGPYPYAKFAVVENFLPTGYGLPSWTLLGSSVVRLPFILDTSLPHEIVHSWWGNAVEVDYPGGNWAEGLTTYLADYLLKERSSPAEAIDYRNKLLRDYAALVTPANDFPLREFTGRTARYQQAVGYGKSAMVFHMLRRHLGDEKFFTGLRRLAVDGTGRRLGWADFERVFSQLSGEELRWFFGQWVEQAGAPQLSLEAVAAERGRNGWTVRGVIRQDGAGYRLAVPLRLTTATGEMLTKVVATDGSRTPFAFEAGETPRQLLADPESDLFRRLDPAELPATVNDLTAPQRPLVIVADGRRELLAAAAPLLKGLHWETAPVVGEAEAATLPLTGRDLLLIGWPERAALRPAPDQGLRLATDGTTTWQAGPDTVEGATLFAVFAGRGDGKVALFQSMSAGAARAAAAKISHYGRYSLLLFSAEGRNLVKNTRDAATSPLRVDLTVEGQP